MSKQYDVSDFDATQLNKAIDDTNFPSSRNSSVSSARGMNNTQSELEKLSLESPVAIVNNVVKPTTLKTSLSDEVFDIPGTPKTPRTLTTPGDLTLYHFLQSHILAYFVV